MSRVNIRSFKRPILFAIPLVSFVLACFAVLTPVVTHALTTTPTTMNFQGRLTDASGSIMPNGLYNMQFKLFTVSTGGSNVWNETRETTARVQVTNGLFSTKLGEVTPIPASLFASGSLYFEITLPTPATSTCSTAACATWESPMTPRHGLSTSAYAFNSDTLDGLDSTAFGQLTTTNSWTGTNTVQLTNAAAFKVQNASSLALLTADTANNILQVGSSTTDANALFFALDKFNNGTDPTGTDGAMYYNTNTSKFRCYQGAWMDCIAAGSGASTTLNNLGSTTINAALNATSTNLTLQTTTSGNIILNAVGTTELQDDTNVGGNLNIAASKYLRLTGGNTASRPGSPSEGMVYYDTDTKQLLTYANGKWQADRSDAVLVAASNSSAADKAAADYIADGNTGAANDGDQVQINSALTAGSGKKVVLLAGTYTADATILIPNNTMLSGVGNGTVVEYGVDVSDNLIENSDITTGKGITIRDMTLDGRSDVNTTGSISGARLNHLTASTVEGVYVKRFKSYGITLDSVSDNNKIVNNTFDTTFIAVYMYNSDYNKVTNNHFNNNTYSAVTTYVSKQNVISNNTITGGQNGVEVDTSTYTTVVGNTIEEVTGMGIYLVQVSGSTVSSNTINNTNNGGTGIYLNTSNDNNIVSNLISGTGLSTDNSGLGLADSDNNNISDNIIDDNSCTITCFAIYIDTPSASNSLSNNKLRATSGGAGISDTSTTTRYMGQSRSNSGLDPLFKQAASTTAFQIQNASSAALLTADSNSTNNRIQIGSSTTDATAIFFMLDKFNNGTDPTGTDGAMYYNTNTSKFRCYQGAWMDCIGANMALSNLASVAINTSLISDTTNTDDLGSSGITWRSGYFGTSLSSPIIRPTADGTTAFKLQNTAGSLDFLTLDTTNSRLIIGVSNTTGTLLVLDTKTDAGDPAGVAGAMYYNSSSKSFMCYKNTAWNECNLKSLRTEWVLQEDFNTNTTTAGTAANLSNIGNENWTFVSIGAGGTLGRIDVGANASNQDRFGVMQMNSPATVTTGVSLRLDNTGMAGVPSNMTVEFDIAPVNAAAANGLQQTIRIGLLDSVTNAAPTDGIYFQYNTTTAAGNWFRCTQVTCVDTNVGRTTTANTYQRLKFETNAAGTAVEFFIDEASVGTTSTNLPGATASYGPTINVNTVDATVRQWKIDYFQIYRSLTTLR